MKFGNIHKEIIKFLKSSRDFEISSTSLDLSYLRYIIDKYRKITIWIIRNINLLDSSTINKIVDLAKKNDSRYNEKVNHYSWDTNFNTSNFTDDIFEYFFYQQVQYDSTYVQVSAIHDAWAMSKIFKFYKADNGIIYVKMSIEKSNASARDLLTIHFTPLLFAKVRSNRLATLVDYASLDESEKAKDFPVLDYLKQ